jgi:hypothetical protein
MVPKIAADQLTIYLGLFRIGGLFAALFFSLNGKRAAKGVFPFSDLFRDSPVVLLRPLNAL